LASFDALVCMFRDRFEIVGDENTIALSRPHQQRRVLHPCEFRIPSNNQTEVW